MDDWIRLLQGALFVGFLIASTFVGLQRGQVRNLKETVEGLRGDRDDLTKRIDDRDLQLAEERTKRAEERAADQASIAELTSAVDVLRSTVTGEAHLVSLEGAVIDMAGALATHHTEAMASVGRIETAINGLSDNLGGTP